LDRQEKILLYLGCVFEESKKLDEVFEEDLKKAKNDYERANVNLCNFVYIFKNYLNEISKSRKIRFEMCFLNYI
jgi:hypothetical protein